LIQGPQRKRKEGSDTDTQRGNLMNHVDMTQTVQRKKELRGAHSDFPIHTRISGK
jgi:hypothetical protein